MVQLRSCYFCGTTEALSERETLPERFDGEEASRRVVLCDRCHAKLTNVLAPIVDRLERESVGSSPPEAPSAGEMSTAVSDRPAPNDPPTQADVTFGGSSAADDAGPSSSPPDPTSPASDTTEATDATAGTADSTGEHEADDPDEPSDGDDADTRVAAVQSDAPEDTRDAVDDGPDAVAADDDTTDSDPDPATTTPDDPDTTRTDLDRVYHKLLRFLRNREFPIPRTEAERIAQSAYDLTAPEASEVIQRAVDRGVLEERDGELHRN